MALRLHCIGAAQFFNCLQKKKKKKLNEYKLTAAHCLIIPLMSVPFFPFISHLCHAGFRKRKEIMEKEIIRISVFFQSRLHFLSLQ